MQPLYTKGGASQRAKKRAEGIRENNHMGKKGKVRKGTDKGLPEPVAP